MQWSEEQDTALRLHLEAGMSASESADRLGNGLSRNAIIGRRHRLGLSPYQRPKVKRKRVRNKLTRLMFEGVREVPKLPEELMAKAAEAPAGPFIPAHPVQIMELTHKTCRWPIEGEGVAMWYCGEPNKEDRPYCKFHCTKAYGMKLEQKPKRMDLQWV